MYFNFSYMRITILFTTYSFISLMYSIKAQVIFEERFNNLSLSSYTTSYTTTHYTTVPSVFIEISEGYKNQKGSSLHPNAPFHTDSLQKKGWGIMYNTILKDTFLVSTSWVDTNKAISRWIISPIISGISINSVLHWKAMSPDPTYADGYAVYVTTNTSTIDTSIFTSANKVFQINDNSTSGGGEKQQWTHRSISLANYSGQSIRIAFKNISRQKYQLWIDDIVIENLSNAYDISLENIGNTKYVLVNQPFHLKCKILNQGYQTVSNVQLAYSIQGISYNSQSFSLNTNLIPLATTTIAFTNTLAINTAGLYKVKMWVGQVNGQNDQNHFNDTISYYLSVLSNSITPKVLLEQFTDASLSYAPAYQDTLMSITHQDTNCIAIQIHQKDSLQLPYNNLFFKNYNLPENQLLTLVNRTYFSNEDKNYFSLNDLRTKINSLKNNITPCNISISNVLVDTILRKVQLDVSVTFLQDAVGDYRVNVYLMENTVYGNPADTSINGYNQLSAFYYTPYSNYYQQGYFSNTANAFVLNAYQYKHNIVANYLHKGIYGDNTVIPNNPVMNTTYTQTYTLNVPTTTNAFRYNFDNLYLIAYVYEHDSLIENRKILNAVRKKVTTQPELVGISENSNFLQNIVIYPNPASKYIFIQGIANQEKWNGKIFNLFGKEVLEFHQSYIDISMLSEGMYVVYLVTENGVISKKLIIQQHQ